jgi:P27 family predicted phage terminase small subunit
MGRRGPQPTPTKLKILRGNPGKRKTNTREPEPTAKAPAMPAWICGEARAEWGRVVPELTRLGLLSVVDRGTLTAYCLAWAELVSATKLINEQGRVVEEPILDRTYEPTGYIRKKLHPAVKLQRDAFARVKQFLGEFGLSPSSRARLQMPTDGPAQDDPLRKLLDRQAAAAKPAG